MTTLVLEHIKASDLPLHWAEQLNASPEQTVTVRIETEDISASQPQPNASDDLLFGMWRDREDMVDVDSYMHKLRAPRFSRDGTRNDSDQG